MLYKKFFFASFVLSNILLFSTYMCGMDHNKLSGQGVLISLARLSAQKILDNKITPQKNEIPQEAVEIIDLQKILTLCDNDPTRALINVCAKKNCHIDLVRNLLKMGAQVKFAKPNGRTALHMAASRGQQAIIALLLEHGAVIEAQDRMGSTPLFYAIALSKENAAELLLQRGAQITAKIRLLKTTHLIKSHPIAAGSIVTGGALLGFCVLKYIMRK